MQEQSSWEIVDKNEIDIDEYLEVLNIRLFIIIKEFLKL
jgi:hypothetical protein